eukprot:5260735-Pleurochrysis_carterae.AAC.1
MAYVDLALPRLRAALCAGNCLIPTTFLVPISFHVVTTMLSLRRLQPIYLGSGTVQAEERMADFQYITLFL